MVTQHSNSPIREQMTREEFRVIWQSIHLKTTDEYAVVISKFKRTNFS